MTIQPITENEFEGFWNALDIVCRERRYLIFTEGPPKESVEDFVRNNLAVGNPHFIAMNDIGEVVGWCDIRRDTREGLDHSACLGMGIIPEYRGKGLGTRLIHAAIQSAFDDEVQRIEFDVFSTNTRAIGLYEKVGFQKEGIRRKARILDGRTEDRVIMGLLKEEYEVPA